MKQKFHFVRLCVKHLHHGVLRDWSNCFECVFHLFQTTWNIFFKQYCEMSPFCLALSLINPACNIPEQHISSLILQTR